jgi:predicted transcriptional regulator
MARSRVAAKLSCMAALDSVRVRDCMHHGIFGCDPEASLLEVAAIMSTHRVHALLVHGDRTREAQIVSDNDVLAGAARGDAFSAKDIAATEVLWTAADRSLREAAQLMTEHGVSHLIVRDTASGEPIGVISTTDILGAYAYPAAELEPTST